MRLLLCDDHALFAHALASALTLRGHRVDVVLDPEDLPSAMARCRPDVATLDVRFARTARLDLPLLARSAWSRSALVLLTGAADEGCWAAYEQGQVEGLVSKATGLLALEAAVARVAGGRRVVVGFTRPAPRRPAGPAELTTREHDVLVLLALGLSTQEASQRLGLSVNTVRSHVQHLLEKLHVHHRVAAVAAAWEQGLIVDAELGTVAGDPGRAR